MNNKINPIARINEARMIFEQINMNVHEIHEVQEEPSSWLSNLIWQTGEYAMQLLVMIERAQMIVAALLEERDNALERVARAEAAMADIDAHVREVNYYSMIDEIMMTVGWGYDDAERLALCFEDLTNADPEILAQFAISLREKAREESHVG